MIVLSRRFKLLTTSLLVLGLTLLLPFAVNIQRAAAPMNHMDDGTTNACQSYCTRLSAPANQQPALNEDQVKPPRPVMPAREAYYLQFQVPDHQTLLSPSLTTRLSVARPPDIVALTTSYRL